MSVVELFAVAVAVGVADEGAVGGADEGAVEGTVGGAVDRG